MFNTILNKLNEDAALVQCNDFVDYVFRGWITDKWQVYNTFFTEDEIDHITIFTDKRRVRAEIVLKIELP
jgi:hypothetical protein